MKVLFINTVIALVFTMAVIGYAEANDRMLYLKADQENLRDAPKGNILGTLTQGTPMSIVEIEGNWVRVLVEGWIWEASTTADSMFVVQASAQPTGPDLELIDYEKKRLPVDYDVNRFSPEAVLTLHVKNNTSNKIKAWQAVLIIKNPFGDTLLRVRLTDGSANIMPGRTAKASFSWEDNQFIDDEPYDKLVAYSKENMQLELTDVQLSQ